MLEDRIAQIKDLTIGSGLYIYAVVDGARFLDIQYAFLSQRLPARSLFRNNVDREIVSAGPWFCEFGQDESLISRAASFFVYNNCAVFWCSRQPAEIIYRHLRILNAARMPDDRVVFFRHYDPDVLADIVPLLEADQASMLLAPVDYLIFGGQAVAGAILEKPTDLPRPASGPLKFNEHQISVLNQRQKSISRNNIFRVLRGIFGSDQISDQNLAERVSRAEVDALKHDLTSERAIFQWCFLSIQTRDDSLSNQNIIEHLRRKKPLSMNDALDSEFPRIVDEYQALLRNRKGS